MQENTQTGTLEYPKFIKTFTVMTKSDEPNDFVLVKIRINIIHISSYLEQPEVEIDGTVYQCTLINCGGMARAVALPIDTIDKMIENTEIKINHTETTNP